MQQPRAIPREKFRDGHKIVVRGVQLCAIQDSIVTKDSNSLSNSLRFVAQSCTSMQLQSECKHAITEEFGTDEDEV